MSVFHAGLGLTWKEYLSEIAENTRYLASTISDHIRNEVASDEALQQEFGNKFDAMHEMLIWELGDISESLEDFHADVNSGFNLVVEELQLQHELTRNPEHTRAMEQFRQGNELWGKGLLPEALDCFNKAETVYRADFCTHFAMGKLYLIGKNRSDDVIDLEQAEKHLRLAARYGEAEMKLNPKLVKLTAEACYHLAQACYFQGVEYQNAGSEENGTRKLLEAFEAAKKGISIYLNIPDNHYYLAKVSALLGRREEVVKSLESAIRANRRYCNKADIDKDFDNVRAEVSKLFLDLKIRAQAEAERRFALVSTELAARQFVGAEELDLQERIRPLITKAEHLIENTRYFDYLNVLVPLGEASKLIDKQKQNESTRRKLQIQVETSYKQLSAAAGELQYESEIEFELKRKIDDRLADAQRFISQASLNDYLDAQNVLNEGLTLTETQKQHQSLRPGITKVAEAKIAAASKILEDGERILKGAEKLRRQRRIVETRSDPFPGLYRRLDYARQILNLSKTTLQQKDYWSIVKAKDLAEEAYDSAIALTGDLSEVV